MAIKIFNLLSAFANFVPFAFFQHTVVVFEIVFSFHLQFLIVIVIKPFILA